MRRRRYRKKQTSLSLFPFLAVLICTMGALIVLLVLGVQQAQVQATEVANSNAQDREGQAAELEKKRLAAEEAQWKWDMLVPAHVEKAGELSNQKFELGHLEQHIRDLEDKWQRLKDDAKLMRAQAQQTQVNQRSTDELKELAAAIKQAEQDLERTRQQLKSRPRSFSLVPYDGPHGTKRRPLYVECTAEGIHLRPENITLTEKDFQAPFGPGNPLAAALRAKRDFLVEQGLLGPDSEPYPLIVVRPGGSANYALAREAMKSWDDEFGYELVAEEMELSFPPRNEQSVQQVQRAITAALERQEFMARAQPRLYTSQGGSGRATMRASRRGGFVPVESRNGLTARSGQEPNRSQQSDANAQRSNNATATNQPGSRNGPDGPGGSSSHRGGREFSRQSGRTQAQNWGLPNSQGRGLKRYVRVACEAGRLIILPARDERARPRIIQLQGATRENVDRFVSQLWEHMKGWGLALPGRYWEPILSVEVAPNGEQRFRELQSELQASGIIVKRKP